MYFDTSSATESAGREHVYGAERSGARYECFALLKIKSSRSIKDYDVAMNCLEHAVTCDVTPHSQPRMFTQLPP